MASNADTTLPDGAAYLNTTTYATIGDPGMPSEGVAVAAADEELREQVIHISRVRYSHVDDHLL